MELTQAEFDVLLRNDLTTFVARTFAHLDPPAYAHNWHIDLLTDRLTQAVKGLVNRAVKGDAKAMQQMLGLSPLVGMEEPGPVDLSGGPRWRHSGRPDQAVGSRAFGAYP